MGSQTIAIDLRTVAQALQLSLRQVESVAQLLDAGNTVPFITRYRKDQTGGLDEEQIRQIESRLIKMRLLAERKQTILRSIESQGKLTPQLAAEIEVATSTNGWKTCTCHSNPKNRPWPLWPASEGWSLWPKRSWLPRRPVPIWTSEPLTSSTPTKASPARPTPFWAWAISWPS